MTNIIDVPPQVISISPYHVKWDKKKFIKYVESNKYPNESKNEGFTKYQILEKGRIASIMLFPMENTIYNVTIKNDNIVYEPKKIKYFDKIIWIYNDIGLLELVGITSKNISIIRSSLRYLGTEVGIDINPSQTLNKGIIKNIAIASKDGSLQLKKIGYLTSINNIKTKHYEYGTEVSNRLIEIEPEKILAVGGSVELTNVKITFHLSRYGKLILYNRVKTPLLWNNIFIFLDKFINPCLNIYGGKI